MIRRSAGLLLFRTVGQNREFFLVHPGGPFFAKKDVGSWSIPKGEFEMEDPLSAAIREFKEETGSDISGDFIELPVIKQKSGKLVYAWGIEADIDASSIISNTFTIEFPPKSGRMREYPEVDRAEWFDEDTALKKIIPAQAPLITDLIKKL